MTARTAPRSPELRALTVGRHAFVLFDLPLDGLLCSERWAIERVGYVGTVTREVAGREMPWRVTFGDTAIYFADDELVGGY